MIGMLVVFLCKGIWGRFRSGIDQVKGSIFERDNANQQQQGQGYPLSQFGVPPPLQRGDQYQLSGGYPPQQPPGGAQQRGGPPPPGYPPQQQQGGGYYPPQQPPPGQQRGGPPGGFMPRPGYSPPYPHVSGGPSTAVQQGAPPIQSQWGNRGAGPPGPIVQQRRPQQTNIPGQQTQHQQKQQGQEHQQMPPQLGQRPGQYGQQHQYPPTTYAGQYLPPRQGQSPQQQQ